MIHLKVNKYSHKPVIYNENDVKELKIVDYFTGLNRLNRYIKKTKERLRSGNKGLFRSSNKQTRISPYKKSLLNVQEIFDFVQKKKQDTQSQHEYADSEAMVIQDKYTVGRNNQLTEKEKWKRVMDYLRENPKTLVDALPDPEPLNQTMYHPLYDEIIDQENDYRTTNVNLSQDNKAYSRFEQDALTLNTQNRDSLEFGAQGENIKIVNNPPRHYN